MKHRVSVLFLLLCSVGVVCASQNIIPLSSPLYGDMEMLYVSQGKSVPSGSRPWTENQARMYLQRIDASGLSPLAASLREEIATVLDGNERWRFPGNFSMGTWLDTSFEAYAHTNTDFDSYKDWTYSFVDRKPLLRLRLDFAIDPFLYTYCDLQYGYGLYTSEDTLTSFSSKGSDAVIGALVSGSSYSDLVLVDEDSIQRLYRNRFSTNLILQSKDFDFQWPKRAILSVGGTNWNFSLSRDRLDWGLSHIGNMVIDDHADFHEFARFVAFSPFFTYEATYIFPDWSYQVKNTDSSQPTYFRVFMLHRLEFRPWDKVTIAVSENVMYKDTSFLPQYLNPSFIYHNLNVRSKFNALAFVEASWVFLPGWNLYGQFVLDQAVAPNENPDAESNAWGGSAGIEWMGAVGKGMLRSALEGAFTLPCMYRRDGIDFIYSRRYAGLNEGRSWNAQLFDYFGFPYGGDAVVVKWDSSWRVPQRGEAGLAVTMLLHGPVTMYTNVIGSSGYTTYGMTMFKDGYVDASLIVTVRGTYQMPHPKFVDSWSLYGNASFIEKTHFDGTAGSFSSWENDIQFTLGCTVTI